MNQDNFAIAFGKLIHERMIELHISAQELAKALGVKRHAIYKYQRAESYPKAYNFVKTCLMLGITMNDLDKLMDSPAGPSKSEIRRQAAMRTLSAIKSCDNKDDVPASLHDTKVTLQSLASKIS
jgi:transcriptional regulator with XRE-family HTH domain